MSTFSSSEGRMQLFDQFQPAMDRTKQLLFQRFDIGVWFSFGLIIFLEMLATGGGGSGVNFPSTGSGNDVNLDQTRQWVMEYLPIILAVTAAVFVFAFALTLLLQWLGSRGTMMFIRATATGDHGIGNNWRATRRTGNSLFMFRLALMAIGFCAMLLLTAIALVIFLGSAVTELWGLLVALLPVIALAILMAFAFAIVQSVVRNFVAPVMYHEDLRIGEAWREIKPFLGANIGPIALFMVYKIVFSFLIGFVALLVGCLTCCIGALPVIGQTILSPLYIFDRSLSLYMIQSANPRYVFIVEPEPPVMPQS